MEVRERRYKSKEAAARSWDNRHATRKQVNYAIALADKHQSLLDEIAKDPIFEYHDRENLRILARIIEGDDLPNMLEARYMIAWLLKLPEREDPLF